MHQNSDDAGGELKAELRRLADTILDLEARGQLLAEPAALLKLLGDVRSRVFAWEARRARPRPDPAPAPPPASDALESGRVVEEAMQREQEAEQEWLKPWEGSGEGEL